MHILEKIAIESFANKLYDEYSRQQNYLMPTWQRLRRETRNSWRQKAEDLLDEGYYNDR